MSHDDFAEFVDAAGLELSPWQRDLAAAMMAGERVMLPRVNGGRRYLGDCLAAAAIYNGSPVHFAGGGEAARQRALAILDRMDESSGSNP